MRKNELIKIQGTKKGRGKPKIRLIEIEQKNMSIKEVTETVTLDRIEQQERIYVADPN